MGCFLRVFNRCFQITSRQYTGIYRKIAFFQCRNKFASQAGQNKHRNDEQGNHYTNNHFWKMQHLSECFVMNVFQLLHNAVGKIGFVLDFFAQYQ